MAKSRIVAPSVSKYPACIFCGAPANSREHAWPKWLLKRLRKQLGPKGAIQIEIEHKPRRSRTAILVPGVVCEKTCNNGWMRRLENDTIPILEPLMLGDTRTLDSQAQLTLSTWAVVRAIICECYQPQPRFYDSTETSHLLNNGTPPDSTFGVWLGHCSPPLAFTDGKSLNRVQDGSLRPEGHVQTMVFGHFFIQVLTIRKPQDFAPIVQRSAQHRLAGPGHVLRQITVDVVGGPHDLAIFRIWPLELQPVTWPIQYGLDSRSGVLHTLADRFNTSVRRQPSP